MKLTASLVLYNNPLSDYGAAVAAFLSATADSILIIIDNSPAPLRSELLAHPRIKYVFTGKNLGFGAGHNRALEHVGNSTFHLLLNPDIQFEPGVLDHLLRLMASSPNIGAVMPRVSYPDGSLQRLCKLLPTPVDLIFRRFIPFERVREWINSRYELHALPQISPQEVPTISGCFLLLRTDLFRKLGGFDERYFMYMEDVDLVRRIGDTHRIIYDPRIQVSHGYGKGSYRSSKLLGYHIRSAVKYFWKWGWIFDRERARRNAAVLARLRARERA